MRFTFSIAAAMDMEEIAAFIARDSAWQAERMSQRILESLRFLASTPGIGHKRSDVRNPELLFWSMGSYLIAYRKASHGIEVVAVTQGSRDVPRLLRSRIHG